MKYENNFSMSEQKTPFQERRIGWREITLLATKMHRYKTEFIPSMSLPHSVHWILIMEQRWVTEG